MAFDAHKNLAISTVATAPSPATSGTTLTVTAGDGGRFPAAPFNATVWPASQPPTPANAELVRVTARTSDSLTITRAVEGSTARSIVAGDLLAATITAKVITDIEAGTNFPQLASAGALTVGGDVVLNASAATIRHGTPDGADTAYTAIAGGGGAAGTQGAYLTLWGNESPAPGVFQLVAGDVAGGSIDFYTGPTTLRGRIQRSGGFNWGGTVDPGAGVFLLGASTSAGTPHLYLNYAIGMLQVGLVGTGVQTLCNWTNANGTIGSIGSTASSVTYNTTSDQRLKTDRGLITDPEVLRSTRVHHFTWNTDGTAGRGVFAQEAVAVLPAAVRVGSDDEDAQGRLVNPWGVDYSKYVPDLIAGWQHHDAAVLALQEQVTTLETAVAVLQAQVARLLARIG